MGGNLTKQQRNARVDDICNEFDNLSLKTRKEQETEKQPPNSENGAALDKGESSVESNEDVTGEDVTNHDVTNEDGTNEDVTNEDDVSDEDQEFDPNLLPKLIQAAVMDAEREVASYRCKLYRFNGEAHEWRERGLGTIRILEQVLEEKTNRRMVMWNDTIGTLACNFSLGPGMKVKCDAGKPKTATWAAFDFSDKEQEEGIHTVFAAKFSNDSERDDFISKFTLYCADPPTPTQQPKETEVEEPVESNCTGCIGCEPDEFTFPSIEVIGKIESVIESPLEPDSDSGTPIIVKLDMFN